MYKHSSHSPRSEEEKPTAANQLLELVLAV
jgi:hypothetical protein